MVDFRKRFGEEGMQRIAEAIAWASLPADAAEDQGDDRGETPPRADTALPPN